MGKGLMMRNSYNAEAAELSGKIITHRLSCGTGEAWATGVEWHHAAGHSSGRPLINFYAKTEAEMVKVNALEEKVKARALEKKLEKQELKKSGLPTSKAAAWRLLTDGDHSTDCGQGSVDARNGKYGWFVNSFGEPDATFYFKTALEAETIRKLLKI